MDYHFGPCLDQMNKYMHDDGMLMTKFYFQIPECIKLVGCLNVPGGNIGVEPGSCDSNGKFMDGIDHNIRGEVGRVCAFCKYESQDASDRPQDFFSQANAMIMQTLVTRYCMPGMKAYDELDYATRVKYNGPTKCEIMDCPPSTQHKVVALDTQIPEDKDYVLECCEPITCDGSPGGGVNARLSKIKGLDLEIKTEGGDRFAAQAAGQPYGSLLSFQCREEDGWVGHVELVCGPNGFDFVDPGTAFCRPTCLNTNCPEGSLISTSAREISLWEVSQRLQKPKYSPAYLLHHTLTK